MAFEVISQRAGYNAIYYRTWALRARATGRACGDAAVARSASWCPLWSALLTQLEHRAMSEKSQRT